MEYRMQTFFVNTQKCIKLFASFASGFVDPEARFAHPDRRHPDLHERPALPVAALGWLGRVDAENQLAANARLGRLRVPSQHRAQNQQLFQTQRRQWVYSNHLYHNVGLVLLMLNRKRLRALLCEEQLRTLGLIKITETSHSTAKANFKETLVI